MATEPELIIRFKGDTKDLDSQLDKLKSSLGELDGATNKAAGGNKKLEDSNNSLGNSVGKLVKGYLSYEAALATGKYILNATLEVSKFETQLNTASGSQEKFGQNMAFLEDLANTYKKNVVDLGASFSQLTIATKGANLEGEETEKLFKAVTVASSALKMSTDDTTGTFRAFIQMVSKGNVQAEELRGQLGERLYGAFNLAAKAMGVSTSELNKLLEKGEVLASDLLPKLSNELLETFSKDAANGAQTLGSNIDYASGQLTLFVAELAKTIGLESSVNKLVTGFGDILSTLRKLNKESGVVKGFFDRMFTLPGNSIENGDTNSRLKSYVGNGKDFRTKEFYDELGKIMRGAGSVSSTSKSQSSTSTDDYGKQYDIYDPNKKAEEQIKKANEAAARKRLSNQRKIDAEELRESKQALEDKLAQSEYDINAAYARYNSVIQNVIAMSGKTGLNNIYDSNSFDKIGEEFTNAVSGDGKTAQRWSELTDATKNGMSKFVSEVRGGVKNYKSETNKLLEDDAIAQLGENISASLANAAASAVFSFAEMAGSALAGGEGFADAGKKFGLIIAGMLSDIGKALIAFATLKIAASKVFSNPYVALAVGVAAVVAGAYLKTKLNNSEGQGLYTGGFVQGPAGTDNVPTRLTAGELVLNKRQQSNMFGLINGTNTGRNFNRNFATSGNNSPFIGQLSATIRSGDLAVAVEIGEKKNRKFR